MLNNIFLKTLRDQRTFLTLLGHRPDSAGCNHGAFLPDHQQDDRF